MMNLAVYSLISLELLAVAWIDLRKRTISNFWAIGNVFLAIGLYLALPDSYPLKWQSFLFPVGLVVFGFLLFLTGIMGAGDSKYLASLFLLVPGALQGLFFEAVLSVTILVGGVLLLYRIVKGHEHLRAYLLAHYWQGLKEVIQSRFSYAPVIFLAWIYLGVRQWA